METLVQHLLKETITVGIAESMTGGACAHAFVQHSGISKIFKGSIVCYQDSIKSDVLGVPKTLIETYGVVSKEVCEAMVEHAETMFKSQLTLSVTGYAETPHEAYISCKFQEKIHTKHITFNTLNREDSILYVVSEMIRLCKVTLFH